MKSGGPEMTVGGINSEGKIICEWFEGERPRSRDCWPSQLILIEPKARDVDNSEDITQRLPRAIVDLEERLATLEGKFETRGYNTRPMYEVHEQKIRELEVEITEIKKRLANSSPEAAPSERMEFRDGMLWAKDDPNPFCAPCFEASKVKLHLQSGGANPGQRFCTNCKNWFTDRIALR